MASLERTAYPRFPRVLTSKDLLRCYTPAAEEISWAQSVARKNRSQLGLLTLLKCFQQLHYFPSTDTIPESIPQHILAVTGLPNRIKFGYGETNTLYRHHTAIRTFLGITPYYGSDAASVAQEAAHNAAEVLDQRVDIINAMVDELAQRSFELPAFSTLDKMAEAIHNSVQESLFAKINDRLKDEEKAQLDKLIANELSSHTTTFNRLKKLPKRASKRHLEEVLEQLQWLQSLGDIDSALKDVPAAKVRHLAAQAGVLDAANLKVTSPERRYAMILALIQRMRVRALDDLAEMFIRRVSTLAINAQPLEKVKV